VHRIKLPFAPVEKFLDDSLNATLEAHQVTVQVLSTPNLVKTIMALYNYDARRVAEADIDATMRAANLDLPPGSFVYFHEFSDGWEVEAHVPVTGGQVIVGFSSIRGFYTR